jgi:hypothetical protein
MKTGRNRMRKRKINKITTGGREQGRRENGEKERREV